jgi:hypothetical protein
MLLANLGLPLGSSLSVLVVETLPQITNIFEHVSHEATALKTRQASDLRSPSPVSDELGHHRLLRTSPLTEVPPVC